MKKTAVVQGRATEPAVLRRIEKKCRRGKNQGGHGGFFSTSRDQNSSVSQPRGGMVCARRGQIWTARPTVKHRVVNVDPRLGKVIVATVASNDEDPSVREQRRRAVSITRANGGDFGASSRPVVRGRAEVFGGSRVGAAKSVVPVDCVKSIRLSNAERIKARRCHRCSGRPCARPVGHEAEALGTG